ncbi:unnamed protein product [Rhizophagus irregularis]|nr:unnamed protein product [Rhizophagus irregularis]
MFNKRTITKINNVQYERNCGKLRYPCNSRLGLLKIHDFCLEEAIIDYLKVSRIINLLQHEFTTEPEHDLTTRNNEIIERIEEILFTEYDDFVIN